MKKKYKRKYFSGVQNITNDSLDKSELQNKKAQNSAKTQAVTSSVSAINPIVGGFMSLGSLAGNYTQNEDGIYKNKASELIDNQLNVETGISNISKMFSGKTSVSGQANFFTGGLFGKSYDQQEKEETLKKIKEEQILKNANNRIKRGSSTDAQSFLAKKGKYKVKARVIESEGREPVFSPKKADGSRDLLYYNPQGKTHAEGGVKLAVVPNKKYKKGTNKLEGDLISKVIMNRNQDKDFVKRTAATNMFKTWEDFDTKATHKMGYGEDDNGQTYMFPTIMNPNNEAIKVPNQYAEYISKDGYKKATGMKYKCGTSKMKYGDGSKKLKYKSSITDDRDKTPIEKLNTKTPILNNNNTPPPERVVKPVIDKLSIRQSNINVPEINKNINLKKTPEFIGPSQEINIDPREKEGIEFLKGKTPTLKIENKINKPILKKIPVAKSTNPIIKKPINTREATFFTYGFYDHNNNGKNDFEEEVNRSSKKMKQFYGKMNTVNIDNRDPQRNVKLINALKKVKNNSDLYLLDHAGSNLYGMSHDQLAATVAANTKHLKGGKNNFYLGSCFGGGGGNGYDDGQFVKKLNSQTKGKTFKNLYSTNHQLWQGTDPSDKHKTPEDVFLPNKADRLVVKNKMGNKAVKYKKGTKSIQGAIPEGSSIVTAEGSMNKAALLAYKNKDWKTLDKIINSMPEDKGAKKDDGSRKLKKYKRKTTDNFTESPVLGGKGYGSELSSTDAETLYSLTDQELKDALKNKGIKSLTYTQEVARRKAVTNKQKTFDFNYKGKTYKNYSSGDPAIQKLTPASTSLETPDFSKYVNRNEPTNIDDIPLDIGKSKKKSFNMSNIPSLFELGAKVGALSQGIDKVPENYLYLNRYKYASQLPKILAENNMDTNVAKQNIKNMSAGNTGTYLSNISNLYSQKFKANNAAVVQDTLARQDILNKNVDIDNTEAQVNRSLKDQYADIRARRRGAYQNMLISAGQSADEAVNTYNANKAQDNYNQQYLNVLKDMYPNYTLDENGNKIVKQRKGAKNLKYRRK